jgi:hypothetical protein
MIEKDKNNIIQKDKNNIIQKRGGGGYDYNYNINNLNKSKKKYNKILKIINNNKFLKLYNKLISVDQEKYKVYINEIQYLSIQYFKNTSSLKFDNRMVPYYDNKYNILKSKFICWDRNMSFFYLCKLYEICKYDKILCLSKNHCLIESIKFYNKEIKITHLDIDYNQDETINKLKTKMKEIYKYNNIKLEEYNTDDKYNIFLFDAIYKTIRKNFLLIPEIEKENLYLIKKSYLLLKNLNKEGTFILYIYSALNEDTLLLLQNIGLCFKKINIIMLKSVYQEYLTYFSFIFIDFIGIQPPLKYLTSKFVKSMKKWYKILYKNVKEKYENYLIIKQNKEYLDNILYKNLITSYNTAKLLDFEVYDIKKNYDQDLDKSIETLYTTELNKSLHSLYTFESGIYSKLRKHENIIINININNKKIPQEIKHYVILKTNSTNHIDTRPIHIWDEVKKFIRYYEKTLNKELMKNGIKIDNTTPVSRAWIKFYELLHETKIFNNIKGKIKIFHICEAPGTFIQATKYYLNKFNKDSEHEYDATTLNPKYGDKRSFSDSYGLMKRDPIKWTFGKDDTGDITKEINIKYYKELCKNKDWIIGDCGLAWDEDSSPGILLYYSQILFILYNLKNDGGCVFKQILNIEYKIINDMIYLLFNSFEYVYFYKPTQNSFSGEFYIVCKNYNNIITDKQFDILFSLLTNPDLKKISIIEKYSDEFIYQYGDALNKIITNLNLTIDKQLFYTDFWSEITEEHKKEIKDKIHIKNQDWIDYYL